MEKIPFLKSPCSECPFRNDEKGIKYLGRKKAKEILEQNKTIGFICHNTTKNEKPNEISIDRRQCAGAMILAKKTNTFQPFANIYRMIEGEEIPLINENLIVDTEEEFIEIQKFH